MAVNIWLLDSIQVAGALILGMTVGWATLMTGRKWLWVSQFLILSGLAVFLGVMGRRPDWAARFGLGPIVWDTQLYILQTFIFSTIFVYIVRNWPTRRSRPLIMLLGIMALLQLGVLPSLGWILSVDDWKDSKTLVTNDGVCIQTTTYSCGPAAAVSGLFALGIEPSSESALALAAKTNQFTGTQPVKLLNAIEYFHGRSDLVRGRILTPESVDTIPGGSPCIALIRHSRFMNHYVCILGIDDELVYIADPEQGARSMPREAFNKIFQKIIIQLIRFDRSDLV